MTKKLIALTLILSLLAASTNCILATESAPVFQSENSKLLSSDAEIEDLANVANLSADIKENIKTDINVLEENGLSGFDLTEINISNEEVFYTLEFEDITDIVSVKILQNGSTQLHFIEGSKEDILIKTASGKLYLNGNEVTFSENNQNVSVATVDSSIVSPCAGFTFSTTATCPYGSAADYTYSAGNKNNANVAVGNFIKNITTGTLVSIMFAAMTASGITAGALIAGTLTGVAGSIINYAVNYNPSSQNLSFKSTTYYHKSTKAYAINNTLKVKKVITKWYSEKNYSNFVKNDTSYTYGVWG